eukprot:gene7548-8147_t
MSADSLTSVELWAAAHFIGRECATQNKEFVLCKKEDAENPNACLKQGEIAKNCANNVTANLKKQFPKEFASFAKCLDVNDYRFEDCRIQERALVQSFNNANTASS